MRRNEGVSNRGKQKKKLTKTKDRILQYLEKQKPLNIHVKTILNLKYLHETMILLNFKVFCSYYSLEGKRKKMG